MYKAYIVLPTKKKKKKKNKTTFVDTTECPNYELANLTEDLNP